MPPPRPRVWLDGAWRAFFPAGALHAILAMAAWFAIAEARRTGFPLRLADGVPPAWVHAHAMFFGTFAFFVFGFLGTAFPRWAAAPPPSPRTLATWLALLVAGQTLWFAGPALHRLVHVAACAFEIAAWMALLTFLARTLRRGGATAKRQPALVLAAVALAPLGIALDALAFSWTDDALHAAARTVALRGFLLLTVVGVASRVVPFFVASAAGRPPTPRSAAFLPLWMALGGVRVALSVAPLPPEAWPARAAGALDLALAALLAREVLAWGLLAGGRRNAMLGVLALGLAWVTLALAGGGAIALLAPALAPLFELPVLHALAVGGFATLVLGMSARVTLGHGGRPIAADGALLACFAAIQVATLVRVALPLSSGPWPAAPVWSHWAALPWGVAFALWLRRLGPVAWGSDDRAAAPAVRVSPPR